MLNSQTAVKNKAPRFFNLGAAAPKTPLIPRNSKFAVAAVKNKRCGTLSDFCSRTPKIEYLIHRGVRE